MLSNFGCGHSSSSFQECHLREYSSNLLISSWIIDISFMHILLSITLSRLQSFIRAFTTFGMSLMKTVNRNRYWKASMETVNGNHHWKPLMKTIGENH